MPEATVAHKEVGRTRIDTFKAPAAKWWQAAIGLFMMSLVGLKFYPALLPLLIFFFWRWRTDRYALMVELMIFFDGSGMMPYDVLPVKSADIGLIVGIIAFILYRKNAEVKKVGYAMIAYFAALFLIAMTSKETMSIQFLIIRGYMLIAMCFVPLLIFANRRFEWQKFINSLTIHILIICGFFVIDTFVIGGFLLLPDNGFKLESTFYDLYIEGFLSNPRHYPRGLFWLVLCVMAINTGELRFSKWQWLVIALAMLASRTNSFLFALIVCYVVMRPQVKQTIQIGIVCVAALVAAYGIDKTTGGYLRLAENIEQFTSLKQAEDEEDLARFGTGRMAQIIPKWMLLNDMDRLWLGFGFLHPEKTTNPEFVIHNYLYFDGDQAEEVATGVEVTQIQTIFDCGVLGLIIQTAFFVGVYFIIRKLKYAKHYLNAVIGISVVGIGGYAGLNGVHGLSVVALALGAVLCANKPLSLEKPAKLEQ